MSSIEHPNDNKIKLRKYVDCLLERYNIISELSNTSNQIYETLKSDSSADISALLNEREKQCNTYAQLGKKSTIDDNVIYEIAGSLQNGEVDEEIADLAQRAVSLRSKTSDIAGKLMKTQKECESILKQRLQIMSEALKSSQKRRDLDAKYGPACSYETPTFIDKQR
ncbi:MAG: hypothetical protein SNJ70_07895 [Armatimonadota bacterium]